MTYLDDLIADMRDCEDDGDTEGAHLAADAILLLALKALAKQTGDPDVVAQTAVLIESYNRVPKWYA